MNLSHITYTQSRPAKRPRLSGPPRIDFAEGFAKPKSTSSTSANRKINFPAFESHFGDSTDDVGEGPSVSSRAATSSAPVKRRVVQDPFNAFKLDELPIPNDVDSTSIQTKPPSKSKLPQLQPPSKQLTVKLTSKPPLTSSTPSRSRPDPFLFDIPQPPSSTTAQRKKPLSTTRLSHSSHGADLKPLRPPPSFPFEPPKPVTSKAGKPLLRPLPPPPPLPPDPKAKSSLSTIEQHKLKPISSTGIGKATDTSLLAIDPLSTLLLDDDDSSPPQPDLRTAVLGPSISSLFGLDDPEPEIAQHPLKRGLDISPAKDRSRHVDTSTSIPYPSRWNAINTKGKYVKGGLAAAAAAVLTQTRTAHTLWEKSMRRDRKSVV